MAHPPEFDPMLLLLGSVLRPRGALYVSGALTSGLTHLDRRDDADCSDLRRANERVLTDFADRLRARRTEPVIDPGLLRVHGWSGHDYGEFFLMVIDRFACEIHFADGWHYSRGATKEYLCALRLGIPAYDEHGEPLSAHVSADLVAEAVEAITRSGHDASRMLSRLADIRQLSLR